MLFSQPASAGGSCLSFTTVTRHGGDMVLMLSWQSGIVGVEDEQGLASRICASISRSIDELANA